MHPVLRNNNREVPTSIPFTVRLGVHPGACTLFGCRIKLQRAHHRLPNTSLMGETGSPTNDSKI